MLPSLQLLNVARSNDRFKTIESARSAAGLGRLNPFAPRLPPRPPSQFRARSADHGSKGVRRQRDVAGGPRIRNRGSDAALATLAQHSESGRAAPDAVRLPDRLERRTAQVKDCPTPAHRPRQARTARFSRAGVEQSLTTVRVRPPSSPSRNNPIPGAQRRTRIEKHARRSGPKPPARRDHEHGHRSPGLHARPTSDSGRAAPDTDRIIDRLGRRTDHDPLRPFEVRKSSPLSGRSSRTTHTATFSRLIERALAVELRGYAYGGRACRGAPWV
jgi:hypothetical protein